MQTELKKALQEFNGFNATRIYNQLSPELRKFLKNPSGLRKYWGMTDQELREELKNEDERKV